MHSACWADPPLLTCLPLHSPAPPSTCPPVPAGVKAAVNRLCSGGFDAHGFLTDEAAAEAAADEALSGVDAREAARRAADPINRIDIPAAGEWVDACKGGWLVMGAQDAYGDDLQDTAARHPSTLPRWLQCARRSSAWRRRSRSSCRRPASS